MPLQTDAAAPPKWDPLTLLLGLALTATIGAGALLLRELLTAYGGVT